MMHCLAAVLVNSIGGRCPGMFAVYESGKKHIAICPDIGSAAEKFHEVRAEAGDLDRSPVFYMPRGDKIKFTDGSSIELSEMDAVDREDLLVDLVDLRYGT